MTKKKPSTPIKNNQDLPYMAGRLMSRRELIKTGFVGTGLLLLSNACAKVGIGFDSIAEQHVEMKFLPVHAQKILFAVFNGLAHPFLPDTNGESTEQNEINTSKRNEILSRMLQSIDVYLAAQPENIQSELKEAFDFLDLKPVRFFLAGIVSPWSDAGPSEINSFLDSWLTSNFMIFRSIATVLQSLSSMAYFDQPESWPQISYPDPSWVFQIDWSKNR